jgi:hypothetical protein
MTGEQYKAAIKALGLNNPRAARWLGICGRTSQYYAAGTRRVPRAIAMLLQMCVRFDGVETIWPDGCKLPNLGKSGRNTGSTKKSGSVKKEVSLRG